MTRTSRSPSPAAGANIGVPNESYVLDLLDGHNAYQRPGLLVAPEHNTLIDFILQFLPGHVRGLRSNLQPRSSPRGSVRACPILVISDSVKAAL